MSAPPTNSSRPRAREGSWSFLLGRFFGIDVYLHGTFLALLAVLGLTRWYTTGDLAQASTAVLGLALVFGCVLLHEYGHALTARHYGVRTRRITLLPIGGVAQLERMPEKPTQELLVALAGPAVNAVLALMATPALLLLGSGFEPLGVPAGQALAFFVTINVALCVFNLLPAFPMDGGRVLRAALAMRMNSLDATRIAAGVGRFMAVGLAILGFFVNPMLVLIAVFVWFGGAQELLMLKAARGLAGASVRQAMRTQFTVLQPHDSLERAAALAILGNEQHFPVLVGGDVVGMLAREDLVRSLQTNPLQTVGEVMVTRFDTLGPGDALDKVLPRLFGSSDQALVVMEGPQLVGLLTREGLQSFLTLRSAMRNPTPA